MNDLLTAWFSDWLNDGLTYWLNEWMNDWLTEWWLNEWMNDWLTYLLPDFLTDWMNEWMTDWMMTEWRTDWLTDWLTYLLTPFSRVLLESLTGFQLLNKFPAFYGTPRFITASYNCPPTVPILSQLDPVHTPHIPLPEDLS